MKGFLSGTDDFVTKPVDEAVMLLRIKALLRRARIISDCRLMIGSTTLDYDTLTVTGREGLAPYGWQRARPAACEEDYRIA